MIKKNNQSFSFAKGTTIIGKIIKAGQVIYENFKNLIVSGIPPLTLSKSKGVDLVDYKIYGESVQDGTPTPEAPIEVKSVGEKTKNLFNNDTNLLEKVTYYNSSGSTGTRTGYKILLPAGTYTAHAEGIATAEYIYGVINSSDNQFIQAVNIVAHNTLPSVTFTISEGDILYIYNGIASQGVSYTKELFNSFNIQIELGTKVTEYEPYGYKIPVKVSGKNLFDSSIWEPGTITLDRGEITPNKTLAVNPNYYEIKSNTQYILSCNTSYSLRHVYFYDKDKNYLGYIWSSRINPYVFTSLENAKYIRLVLEQKPYTANNLTEEDIKGFSLNSKVQIELGTKTDYEPYVEPVTTNIYLDEPLRKVEEYADYIDFENKQVIRQTNKINLKDYKWISNNGTPAIYYIQGLNPLPISSSGNCSVCNVLDSVYISGSNSVVGIIALNTGIVRARPDLTIYDTIEKWQEYVNNNESYLLYSTADTPEPIELPNIPTFKGTTILSVDTAIQPSNAEVIYKGKS